MRLLLLFAVSLCCLAQEPAEYVFGFLRAHPQRKEIPQEQAMEIQKGHMAHLGRMSRENGLVGAGPLADSKDIRGILIFRGVTLEQARSAASEDPAVKNERLVVDLFRWPSRAGIGDKAIAKMKEGPDAKWTMSQRSIVIYVRGTWPTDMQSAENQAVLQGHNRFREQLEAGGQLFALGALLGSREFLGVAIYKTSNAAEALKAVETDPLVKSGWVKAQAYGLYIADEVF